MRSGASSEFEQDVFFSNSARNFKLPFADQKVLSALFRYHLSIRSYVPLIVIDEVNVQEVLISVCVTVFLLFAN